MNPADNIPIPDAYELPEYREELLLRDGWARCEACGEVVASLTPVTDDMGCSQAFECGLECKCPDRSVTLDCCAGCVA